VCTDWKAEEFGERQIAVLKLDCRTLIPHPSRLAGATWVHGGRREIAWEDSTMRRMVDV